MSRIDIGNLKTVWIASVVLTVSALPAFGTGNANLTLVKKVSSNYGGSAAATLWTLTATGPTNLSGAGGVPATWVPPGDYTLAETGTVPGYTNGTLYSCKVTRAGVTTTNPDSSTIHLNVADVAECTITNHDNPSTLELIKKVISTHGHTALPSQWTTVDLGPGPLELSGPGGLGPTTVGAGEHVLSERGTVPGYTNSNKYDCDVTPLVGSKTSLNGVTAITINLGDTVVCTITNHDDPPSLDGRYQVRYASNLTQGDSVINITNTGANGNNLYGPGFGTAAGNVCVNVYAFSPDEQMISCCSCLVTPNGLVHVTANNDLVSNTLTGIRPNSIVIKLVTTATGKEKQIPGEADVASYRGSNCNNSAALVGIDFPLAEAGVLAWGTTLHSASNNDPPTGPASSFSITETPFLPATLTKERGSGSAVATELESLANRCTNIIGNGSSFGICRSCRLGGLGGAKQ